MAKRRQPAASPQDEELLRAIEGRDEARVRALLAAGANPEARRGKQRAIDLVPHRAEGVACALIEAGADPGSRTVVWAVTTRRLETVQALLRRGADPNGETYSGTPLQAAAALGDEAIVEALLRARADLNAGNSISTPLLSAIEAGHEQLALRLLAAGADPSRAAEMIGRPPLHAAAEAGQAEVVRALLRAGADPDARGAHPAGLGEHVTTPALVTAAWCGHAEVVRALLEGGADPFARDEQGKAAIERAAAPAVREALARAGADEVPRAPDERLIAAAEAGDLAGARAALAAGASPDARDARGASTRWTPLMHAARGGHRELVEALLDAGADPALDDAPPDQDDAEAKRMIGYMGEDLAAREGYALRRTALHRTAQGDGAAQGVEAGQAEVAALLLARGAPRDARDVLGNQPLHLAAIGGARAVVELLLARGADPEAKGEGNATPLTLATQHKRGELAQWLLARRPAGRSGKPRRPAAKLLLEAAAAADAALVQSLLAAGADPNAGDRARGCPLAAAAGATVEVELMGGIGKTLGPAPEAPTLACVQALLAAGADPNGRGFLGAALYHAALIGHPQVVRALLAAGADPRGRAPGATERDTDETDTPLFAARARGLEEIAALLEEALATGTPRRRAPAPPARKASKAEPKARSTSKSPQKKKKKKKASKRGSGR